MLFTACGTGGTTGGDSDEEFRVNFNLNYATTDTVPAQSVKKGDFAVAPTEPSRSGFTFGGWYKETECTNKWEFSVDKVTARTVLYAKWISPVTGEIVYPTDDKDFSGMTATNMERAVDYKMFFKPSETSGHVGDLMPYYENGTYHMFYLKDEGGSVRHSIYRADTTDFFSYEDKGETLQSAPLSTDQDNWIGTGSLAKAGNDYYFFYTGHNGNLSVKEKVMVAKSVGGMNDFQRVAGFEIAPDSSLSQNDFRDPQVWYNETSQKFEMIITANKDGIARIVKYTVSLDLSVKTYDGIIFSDTNGFWNLECADIFKLGNYYYLTYSGQDDTLWYARSTEKFSGYTSPKRMEGKLFYAPKSVSDGSDVYMVGWARRRRSASNNVGFAWAGHLAVQKVKQHSDGSLTLVPIDGLHDYFVNRRALKEDKTDFDLAPVAFVNKDISKVYESFMVKGQLSYAKANGGDFGFAFGYGGESADYMHIKISPVQRAVVFTVKDGAEEATRISGVDLHENTTYSFTFIMEGSVGIFYLDDQVALTVRMYTLQDKSFGFFSDHHSVQFKNISVYTRAGAKTN